eukprot:TRINITY_DN1508_c0_g1_i1.p2 TRINITY_DN1508_c0_g1~~TRINITY_DN1508_c0_g1_i1.p2  ORF type:complete len:130 (+),score=23.70 TRINITY_DN1508_c0_g1_i1:813-1202(+)
MTWYYKSDLRFTDENEEGWQEYSKMESIILEEAYQSNKKVVALNEKYKVSLEGMFQYRITDTDKQRPVMRKPPKKKAKLTAVKGSEVWILMDREEGKVESVFAEKSEAIEKMNEKKNSADYIVFSHIVL